MPALRRLYISSTSALYRLRVEDGECERELADAHMAVDAEVVPAAARDLVGQRRAHGPLELGVGRGAAGLGRGREVRREELGRAGGEAKEVFQEPHARLGLGLDLDLRDTLMAYIVMVWIWICGI